jgi:excinuclease ABC subunit A
MRTRSILNARLPRIANLFSPDSRGEWKSSIKSLARQAQLKNIDVDLPGVFACVTGVSGSGKSTLIHGCSTGICWSRGESSDHQPASVRFGKSQVHANPSPAHIASRRNHGRSGTPWNAPINAAALLGLYDRVREVFAAQPEAMSQGSRQAPSRLIPAAVAANVAPAQDTRKLRCNFE